VAIASLSEKTFIADVNINGTPVLRHVPGSSHQDYLGIRNAVLLSAMDTFEKGGFIGSRIPINDPRMLFSRLTAPWGWLRWTGSWPMASRIFT
jgi:hypothetical protein